jgi:hypothetical protein
MRVGRMTRAVASGVAESFSSDVPETEAAAAAAAEDAELLTSKV